jgi:Killing trait
MAESRTFTAPQVTDAVTTSDEMVVGSSPAQAIGSAYQTLGNATAMASANAVFAQHQTYITYQAATTQAVDQLLTTKS